jgi:uncharacterized NAD-dependent epimerase/dehydratase family protein
MILLTQGASTPFLAKTAISLLRYRGEDVVAVLDNENEGRTAQDLFGVGGATPVIANIAQADRADSLAIGIAPPGGKIPAAWRMILLDAARAGLDIVSGLHDFLSLDEELMTLARRTGSRIIDVRKNNERETSECVTFRPGCTRIHTVGHDCSVGKMVTAIEIQRGLAARGHHEGFAATGQTGIMISGEGTPVDCVVSDFVNGAAERLVQRMEHFDYLLIEGQGSIVHPRYSAVTLGLLHGCAPDGLVMCYEVTRENVKGLNHVPLRPLDELIHLYEAMASVRHPCRVIGIGMNSRKVDARAAADERQRLRDQLGLPVCDVLRDGADELVEAAIALRKDLSV